jgi:hypothetical protein
MKQTIAANFNYLENVRYHGDVRRWWLYSPALAKGLLIKHYQSGSSTQT